MLTQAEKQEFTFRIIETPEQVEELRVLFAAYFDEVSGKNPLTLDADKAVNRINLHLKHALARCIAVYSHEEIVGFSITSYDDEFTTEITGSVYAIYVVKEFRKTWATRLLLEATEQSARADGCRYLVTDCPDLIEGTGATYMNLLRKRGYREFSRAVKELIP